MRGLWAGSRPVADDPDVRAWLEHDSRELDAALLTDRDLVRAPRD